MNRLTLPSCAATLAVIPAAALAWFTLGCAMMAPVHLVDGIPPRTDAGDVNVVVEIPAGTLAKWEVDKDDGKLSWEWKDDVPRVVRYLAYPGNYGMVPQTLLPTQLGGDGDPLDVLVLGASAERGAVVAARLIGVLELRDGGEQDDKLIAVTDGSPFESVGSISELDSNFPGVTAIIQTWFENYKGTDTSGAPVMEAIGFAERDRAEAILEAAIEAYATASLRALDAAGESSASTASQ